MNRPALDNLVRLGQLKAEPRNDIEVRRLLDKARIHRADAELSNLSPEGRFLGAYGAAHAAALAALRWHGYRSEHRFTVFQCLAHTLGWPAHRWRVLDAAHRQRNRAEYEGILDVEESTIGELLALAGDAIAEAERLTGSETR